MRIQTRGALMASVVSVALAGCDDEGARVGGSSSTTPRSVTTLLFDDFDDGWAGWSTTGVVAQDNAPALTPNSARLRKDATL